ncbi:putative transcriptional regulator [Candidatus Protochlamydia naegleriophila]|uniref:Putative transcriptional regulator n=1 Tax=Candidatus Protochlamydia naegleriophila TaxID=389348 RepID=A0A0U5JAP0_9BACT|nr:helix-turn-helix domain-containing protein [Candidatus Protochlamydia naegleriophila]CUI16141.1 putative transcriptional regulator [Candidatus Protochlamydia naegleriophila]
MNELLIQLQTLGLTENEARIYEAFLCHGALNGYEVAKKTSIARGNIYAYLSRLVDKGVLRSTSDEKYVPVPLNVFVQQQQCTIKKAGEQAQLALEQLHQKGEEAQVLSLIDIDQVLEKCRFILSIPVPSLFIAAFPQELESLAPLLHERHRQDCHIEAICFGKAPESFPDAMEHASSDQIEQAQGGRLLMLSGFPHGLIAVVKPQGSTGIWAWNRYLSSMVGLYVSHELFIMRMWPLLSSRQQARLKEELKDLSSCIAMAGVDPSLPLHPYLPGRITPQVTSV